MARTATIPRKRVEKGENVKLGFLVFFFFLWIATAGVMLFLYMERYLFPG